MNRLVLLMFVATLSAQTPAARIKIDIDRQIGEVDPLLFGNFAEHLGRMIYGGIYDEGSPLSDADGYRKDVMDAVKRLGVSILRYPGGNFSSGYNWTGRDRPKGSAPDAHGAGVERFWNRIASARMNFCATANASRRNRTSASMAGWAR